MADTQHPDYALLEAAVAVNDAASTRGADEPREAHKPSQGFQNVVERWVDRKAMNAMGIERVQLLADFLQQEHPGPMNPGLFGHANWVDGFMTALRFMEMKTPDDGQHRG